MNFLENGTIPFLIELLVIMRNDYEQIIYLYVIKSKSITRVKFIHTKWTSYYLIIFFYFFLLLLNKEEEEEEK